MKLFYTAGACSLAPHILLNESGAPFELIHVDLGKGEQLTPDFLRINPLGRVPAFDPGDGRILTEVPAILQYLARRFPELGMLPQDPWLLGKCTEWLAFLSTSLHATAVAQFIRPDRFTDETGAFERIRAAGRAAILRHYAAIDTALNGCEWAVPGGCTIADPYLFVYYYWGSRLGLAMQDYRNWSAWARRVYERPAVQRSVATEHLVIPGLTAAD